MRAMLRHGQRLRFGQVHDLPFAVARARQHRRPAALRATHGIMVNHPIGRLDLPQRLAFVASLSAGLLARFLPQASCARLFFQAVARRRFAAVGAVQAKPTLKLSHARRERCNLLPLFFDDRQQRLDRLRLRWLIRLLRRTLKSRQ